MRKTLLYHVDRAYLMPGGNKAGRCQSQEEENETHQVS